MKPLTFFTILFVTLSFISCNNVNSEAQKELLKVQKLKEEQSDNSLHFLENVCNFSKKQVEEYECAKQSGNLAQALNCSDQLLAITDSIALIVRNMKTLDPDSEFYYEKLRREYVLLESCHRIAIGAIFLSFFGLLVLSIVVHCYVTGRNNNKIKEQKAEIGKMKTNERKLKDSFFSRTEIGKKLKSFSLSNPGPQTLFTVRRLMDQKEWDQFIHEFNLSYDNFTSRLQGQYPSLRENDIRLCCLLKLKRNLPDIALLLNINKASVIKKKSRMKLNKMKLRNCIDFDEFLYDF